MRGVTWRKSAVERAEPRPSREQIVESLGDPLIVLDRDRTVLDINAAALRLAGSPADWRGRRVDDLLPFLADAPLTGPGVTARSTIRAADTTYDVRVSPVRAERGAWAVVLRDISEHGRAADEREQFVGRKADLITGAAHELRTPVAAVQGALQLLLSTRAGQAADEERRLLESALRSCERLAHIVHDILDIANIDARRIVTGPQPLGVERVLIDALFDAGRVAAERSVRIETSLAADLPMIHADHDRLVQVLVDLISQAAATTPEGSTVTVAGASNGRAVSLTIRSLGRGQAGDPAALALARALLARDGGALQVEAPGDGTTAFVLTLPPAQAQAPRVTPTTVFPREAATPAVAARILVADDDPDLRDIVGEALQAHGFEVVMAEDGEQALDTLAREPIDLAVLDLNMPNRNGLEVIREVRAGTRHPRLPILVLTGSIDERHTPEGLGADVLLTKPTDLRRLLEEVKRLVGRSEDRPLH